MILDAESEIEVVGEASDGLEAVLAARQMEPDVILMDVRMPNVDGLEATRRLLDGRDEGPRILILTTFDLDEYVYEALRAGASGFLLKDTPPEQLVEAIMIVARGRRPPRAVDHPARDRGVRPPPAGLGPQASARARGADHARARDAAATSRRASRTPRSPGRRSSARRR